MGNLRKSIPEELLVRIRGKTEEKANELLARYDAKLVDGKVRTFVEIAADEVVDDRT